MKYLTAALFLFFSYLVNAQPVDFSFQANSGNFCAPSRIQFTSQPGSNPVGYIWTFGDASMSNSSNPSHTYSAGGTYTVNLLVIYANSTAEVSKQITIHQPNSVGLGADRNYICTPGDITFTATGKNQADYSWDFGDGSVTNNGGNPIAHTFRSLGNYTVVLNVTDTLGCTASKSVSIQVKDPTITASTNRRRGCIPANTGFTASVNIPAGSTVTQYAWDFGDGNSTTTSVNNTSHTYTGSGLYNPTLSITTSEGCTAGFSFPNVAYGTPPTGIIAYPLSDSICASNPATLIAKASGANQYVWQFGDGTSASTGDTLITHKYNSLGVKNISVVPNEYGCSGSGASFDVEVIGVVAAYDFSVNCTQRDRVKFYNLSTGNISSFLWSYGDGQQNDTVSSPVHIYPSSGAFNASLTIVDSITGCSDKRQRTLYTAIPTFTNPDSALCRESATSFKVENSYTNPAARYTYYVGVTVIGPTANNSVTMNPQLFGDFSNFVVINNGPGYCNDTAWLDHRILVRGPALNFTADSALCFNDSLSLNNLSYPYRPQDTVINWTWKIQNDTLTGYQQPPYHFTSTGKQPVTLYATDINGCQDSLVKNVIVNGMPFLRVIPEADTLCAGVVDTLIAFHNGPLTWTSNFAVPCVNCDTIAVAPTADAFYAAHVTSSAGCVSSDTISIRVYEPFNATALNPFSTICPGDSVTLNVAPAGMTIRWVPAMGIQNANAYDPVVTPVQTTQYQALLYDSIGCFSDSTLFTVNVKPAAIVNAGADTSIAYNSSMTINPQYSNNIVQYIWSPRGDLQCLTCPNPSLVANDNYTYIINVTTDSGCVATDSISIFIRCDEANLLLPNAFTPNDDNLNDVLFPTGRGLGLIKRFMIYDRSGKLVFGKSNFRANDPNSGWNGRINGEPASPAVYVYFIEAYCAKGNIIMKKGTVVLLK